MSGKTWAIEESPTGQLWFIDNPESRQRQYITAFDEDMARRIAQCLNFFEGIPIEAIEVLVKNKERFHWALQLNPTYDAAVRKEDSPSGTKNVVGKAFKDMNDEN